jgi:hypothetical protein
VLLHRLRTDSASGSEEGLEEAQDYEPTFEELVLYGEHIGIELPREEALL